MSVYRLHFTWKGKEATLKAASLDLTHPYFVSIKDLLLPDKSSLIYNPLDEELRSAFEETKNLMIPFQSVSLIEELKESTRDKEKLRKFNLIGSEEPEKDKE